MKMRMLGAVSAGLMMAASLGAAAPAPAATVPALPMATSLAAAAVAFQQYYPGPGVYCTTPNDCAPIAYSYEVYSDAELTNLIATGQDSCVGGIGGNVYVTSPQLPSGYEVKTPMYVCSGMGPYLPPEW